MFGYRLSFDEPWYLLLLVLLPVLWIWSYRSLAGLGRFRRAAVLLLCSSVLALLVLSLAEAQLLRQSDKLAVIYLLDQSQSIPAEAKEKMVDYVAADVRAHRNAERGDLAGIIVFGREAAIESPPFDWDVEINRLSSLFDVRTDATNLSAALKLAQATFPEQAARRVVIVTDGNENVGDARGVARQLADDGVGIDIVPVQLTARGEVAVEKITLPPDIRQGQPFEARVVLNNFTEATEENPGIARGTLRILRRVDQQDETLHERQVELPPGKSVFTFEHEIDQPAFYDYRAEFIPAEPEDDRLTQNNRATAYSHVRGKGHVLLIEDWEHRGESDYLVERLKAMNLEVTVRGSDDLFTSLAELQQYDTVVLANVPRSSGGDGGDVTNFSDAQISMLVRNTQQMGSGLVMVGGPNAFGAGGWTNTELEQAMPVDFQIKNAEVQALGALCLVMHASEMAQGNHWQKVVGREALKALGNLDHCGCIVWSDFGGGDSWLWADSEGRAIARVGGMRDRMVARISAMQPGDMPQFDPAMQKSLAEFAKLPDAAVKHMILISDGDASPPSGATMRAFVNAKIQVSTVAIGTHGPPGSTPLQNIATQTGGKYYVVSNAAALPRIYQREARRVARPLIFEPEGGVQPRVRYPHEMLQGIEGEFPPTKGYVMTQLKQNPLVEVALSADKPAGEENSTILASWTYGLGRTVAFTTDSGARWSDQWREWPEYSKLFSQVVRWSMRPSGEQGKFTVASEFRDGRVEVVVTALDENEEFLNFLNMALTVVGPDLETFEAPVRQVAPGRYIADFAADQSGSYFLNLSPGPDYGRIRAGVNVPYSPEFRDRETNRALLLSLASLKPRGGEAGAVVDGDLSQRTFTDLLKHDTFRHTLTKAMSASDVWPYLLLVAAFLFFAEVFLRRVQVGFGWLRAVGRWISATIFRRPQEAPVEQNLERLRRRKRDVSEGIDQRRAAARFEPEPDVEPSADPVEMLPGAGPQPPRPTGPAATTPDAASEDEAYTSRLLEAKRKAQRGRKPPEGT